MPQTVWGLALSAFYLLAFLWSVYLQWEPLRSMSKRGWLFFAGALLLLVPANAFFIIAIPPNPVPLLSPLTVLPMAPALPLLALLLVAVISVRMGTGPGVIAGLMSGLIWSWFHPLMLNDVFAFAAWGLASGAVLRQPYRERLFVLLRTPFIAMLSASLAPLFIFGLNWLFEALPLGSLAAMESASQPFRNTWLLWLLNGLVLGGVFTLAFRTRPAWRPRHEAYITSIFNRSLRARFMIIVIPLLVAGIILSVLAVSSRAVAVAQEQAFEEMARSAANAGDGIAHFYVTGHNLLTEFAANADLVETIGQRQVLETNRQVVPFFQEMLLTNDEGEVISYVPEGMTDVSLTTEEELLVRQALSLGLSQVSHLTAMPSGAYRLTFVSPVMEGEEPRGALLGRVQLNINPSMRRAFETLQSTRGVGEGFILDDRGVIIAHPDSSVVLRPWSVSDDAVSYDVAGGTAYEEWGPEGERLLTFKREVEGVPYSVVMQLPYSAVMETATLISNPLLLVQLLTGIILLLVIPFMATQITRPLQTLAAATHSIAQGNLDIPVRISGEDEVSRLGGSFEQMRLRLRDRLNDLSLLLQVSQSVSATLDLKEGVPLILQGALEETGAAVARFVRVNDGGQSQRVFSVGMEDGAFPALDRTFASALFRRREPLVNQQLPQAGRGPAAASSLRSVAAFPVRSQNRTVAVLWVGAVTPGAFDEARVNFLNTLASQAAVLVENARLFQAAEGGRQRLAAILASTTDAILVTDHERRLVLINPAAQRVLRLTEATYGREISELELPDPLEEALNRPFDDRRPPSAVEVPLSDGRTFYASIAPIAASENRTEGRVVVMRDVTHFKELDEMKSDFVATVSHDLRAPLTFIRGYTTMLLMVGDLNEKQHDYLERILKGIDQMSALIDDLLNLRRIEAGVGIREAPCRLGLVLVEAVDTMRARAASKGINLRLESSVGAPTVMGDCVLLRQAIGNLVDNAIKYTPPGGKVSVGLRVLEKEGIVVVRITDTGIGIAPEDQVRLFEKFYRIKRRETEDISGTGLGLALVKGIVERHHGRVWVDSVLNEGSTFYVALPIARQKARAKEGDGSGRRG
jgi:PAS domain S-box-containing protein